MGCFCNTTCTQNVTDLTENEYGDSYVAPLTVTAGQIYIILVDNFTSNNSGYTMSFGGTAVLGCIPVNLPVELIDFDGYNDGIDNVLRWKTASEKDNDYFILHQSENGIDWNYVGVVNGAGTSSNVIKYEHKHSKYRKELNYYKLSQVDFNGNREEFKIISIDNSIKSKEVLRVVNYLGQDVSSDYEGLRIILFTDGTSIKKIGK